MKQKERKRETGDLLRHQVYTEISFAALAEVLKLPATTRIVHVYQSPDCVERGSFRVVLEDPNFPGVRDGLLLQRVEIVWHQQWYPECEHSQADFERWEFYNNERSE